MHRQVGASCAAAAKSLLWCLLDRASFLVTTSTDTCVTKRLVLYSLVPRCLAAEFRPLCSVASQPAVRTHTSSPCRPQGGYGFGAFKFSAEQEGELSFDVGSFPHSDLNRVGRAGYNKPNSLTPWPTVVRRGCACSRRSGRRMARRNASGK